MSSQNNGTILELDELKDWEKARILNVLDRNHKLRETEERRITQLCVRLQLDRASEDHYTNMKRIMIAQSGSWRREISDRELPEIGHTLRKYLLKTIREDSNIPSKGPRRHYITRNHILSIPSRDRLSGQSESKEDSSHEVSKKIKDTKPPDESPPATETLKIWEGKSSEKQALQEPVRQPLGDKISKLSLVNDADDDGFVSCESEPDSTKT